MTKESPEKLKRRADRYWSDPSRRLARVNKYRRSVGKPEVAETHEIETPRQRAARQPRALYCRFSVEEGSQYG